MPHDDELVDIAKSVIVEKGPRKDAKAWGARDGRELALGNRRQGMVGSSYGFMVVRDPKIDRVVNDAFGNIYEGKVYYPREMSRGSTIPATSRRAAYPDLPHSIGSRYYDRSFINSYNETLGYKPRRSALRRVLAFAMRRGR